MKALTVGKPQYYFTHSEWINRDGPFLSGWPINRKGQRLGRINAGGTNMAKKMLARLEKEEVK